MASGLTVKFYVSSTTSYTVKPGDKEDDVTGKDELDGMLTGIDVLDGDRVISSYNAYEGTAVAEDREEWELIAAAAEIANIMLPDAEDDEEHPVLMFGER